MGKQYFVYILANYKNTVLYVGMTSDLRKRIYQHKYKLADGFTKRYNVWKLVYCEIHEDVYVALEREKQVKNLVRRKKEELIKSMNPEYKELKIG